MGAFPDRRLPVGECGVGLHRFHAQGLTLFLVANREPLKRVFDVALRMQMELQPLKLVVAGSNPAGPMSGGP